LSDALYRDRAERCVSRLLIANPSGTRARRCFGTKFTSA
jgi:hypothetical protein